MLKSFTVSYLECLRRILTFLFGSEDAYDGLAAYLEKRVPEFAG
jgi:hypothetical protein